MTPFRYLFWGVFIQRTRSPVDLIFGEKPGPRCAADRVLFDLISPVKCSEGLRNYRTALPKTVASNVAAVMNEMVIEIERALSQVSHLIPLPSDPFAKK